MRDAESGLHKLAADGQIPKGGDGKFDAAAMREALAANTDPSRQSEPFTAVHGTDERRPHPRAAESGGATTTLTLKQPDDKAAKDDRRARD